MVFTKNGQKLLRSFARDSKAVLTRALNSNTINPRNFRQIIREMWIRRTQLYYDGRDTRVPFFRYCYTSDYPVPHTFDQESILNTTGRAQHFSFRNPSVPQSYVDHFLDIHAADRPPHVDAEHDIFSSYELNGMSSAELYIETRIDRFYRILTFAQELEAHDNIRMEETNSSGNYSIISYDDLNGKFQEILRYDEGYRKILLRWRRCIEKKLGKLQIETGILIASDRQYLQRYLNSLSSPVIDENAARLIYECVSDNQHDDLIETIDHLHYLFLH